MLTAFVSFIMPTAGTVINLVWKSKGLSNECIKSTTISGN